MCFFKELLEVEPAGFRVTKLNGHLKVESLEFLSNRIDH